MLDEHEVDESSIGSNGHDGSDGHEEETPEQLQAVLKNLSDLKRGNGSLVQLGKQEMSLMNKILASSSEVYREEQMWRMCDFLDEDEALDHVAAFYEAKELGMDTSFNVAYAFALVSANRKTNKSNLISMILDTVQHGKWASNSQGAKKSSGSNPRSPLS